MTTAEINASANPSVIDTDNGGDVFIIRTRPSMRGFVLVTVNDELCALTEAEARRMAFALIEAANRTSL